MLPSCVRSLQGETKHFASDTADHSNQRGTCMRYTTLQHGELRHADHLSAAGMGARRRALVRALGALLCLCGTVAGFAFAQGPQPGGIAQGQPPGFNPPPVPGAPAANQGAGKADNVPTLPSPRPLIPGFGPGQVRLPLLDCPPIMGRAPRPTPETIQKQKTYVRGLVDPETTLELVMTRTRLMVLKEIPKRIQIADEAVAGYTVISPKELSLLGRNVGVTVLTIWFPNAKDPTKEEILTYQVRVVPDSELKKRLEQVYKGLADEINHMFPNSFVCLQLVGDKLVVSGFARDIFECNQILRIVRANAPNAQGGGAGIPDAARIPVDRQHAGRLPGDPEEGPVMPGLDNYVLAGSPAIINLLRINGEQQVMLRVTVAEVNRAAARAIGMNFNILNRNGVGVFADNTGSIATGGLAPSFLNGFGGFGLFGFNNRFLGVPPLPGFTMGGAGYNNLPAALDNGRIRLAISALRTLDYARSLAEPTLTAINGQTATFRAGGEFPVPMVSGFTNYGLQGVSFIPYGVQLTFTPYITDRDRIRLVMSASVSSRDLSNGMTFIGGAGIPSLTTRNFQTTVELREGQTLAVAGLVQNNIGADSRRVPGIGDLPILSRLLGFDRLTAGEQELVVLVTPELVHPFDHKEVPPLPGSDIFEPNDCEFYLLGRIESRRPYDYRSPVRTDFGRQLDYYRMERMYLSGPCGHADDQ